MVVLWIVVGVLCAAVAWLYYKARERAHVTRAIIRSLGGTITPDGKVGVTDYVNDERIAISHKHRIDTMRCDIDRLSERVSKVGLREHTTNARIDRLLKHLNLYEHTEAAKDATVELREYEVLTLTHTGTGEILSGTFTTTDGGLHIVNDGETLRVNGRIVDRRKPTPKRTRTPSPKKPTRRK